MGSNQPESVQAFLYVANCFQYGSSPRFARWSIDRVDKPRVLEHIFDELITSSGHSSVEQNSLKSTFKLDLQEI